MTDLFSAIVSAAVEIPEINPRFDAPFMAGFQLIASFALGVLLLGVFLALVFALTALAFHKLFKDNVRAWAGENILRIFIVAALLGSASGVFAWFVGFDFGF